MTKTSKEKQDQRKAEMQAAAERDGFETWSQAITAWKNGEARLTKRVLARSQSEIDEEVGRECAEPIHWLPWPPSR